MTNAMRYFYIPLYALAVVTMVLALNEIFSTRHTSLGSVLGAYLTTKGSMLMIASVVSVLALAIATFMKEDRSTSSIAGTFDTLNYLVGWLGQFALAFILLGSLLLLRDNVTLAIVFIILSMIMILPRHIRHAID